MIDTEWIAKPGALAKRRERILCVDDEPNILEGLELHLRPRWDVLTATSGSTACQILQENLGVAAVVSDMRMPGMDGAAFLANAKKIVPDATRILLTGQAEMTSAIRAVNEGQIFRFLMKPCPSHTVVTAVAAAVEQHRLVTSERVLLEETLKGSLKTLADVLALANPTAFGRANRVKELVAELANKFDVPDKWAAEVAAIFSQLGCVTLPEETMERVYAGADLSAEEQKMLGRTRHLAEELLGNIPRMELVREILAAASAPRPDAHAHRDARAKRPAELLRIALEFDALESQGNSAGTSVDMLRGRGYDREILDALAALRGATGPSRPIREFAISGLRPGMILAQDVRATNGLLLIARGFKVSASTIERLGNLRGGTVKGPILASEALGR